MKVIVRQEADDDLDSIFAWIADDNPRAAVEVIRRLRARIEQLTTPGLAHIGRIGLDSGTRELVEPPYIIVYEVHEARREIEVISIMHGARKRG